MKQKTPKVLIIISCFIFLLGFLIGISVTLELLPNINLPYDSEGFDFVMNLIAYLGIFAFFFQFIIYSLLINGIIWGCYKLITELFKKNHF